jgi:hypothetical protein
VDSWQQQQAQLQQHMQQDVQPDAQQQQQQQQQLQVHVYFRFPTRYAFTLQCKIVLCPINTSSHPPIFS